MKRVDPAKALDECLNRIYNGDSVEACLVEYPNLREQLESLLTTALSISARPKVAPSDEYRRVSKSRLMSQLREMPGHREAVKQGREATGPGILERVSGRLARGLSRPRTLAVPATLLLLLAIGGSLSVIVSLGFPSTPTVLTSQCTLSMVSGEVELQTPGSDIWQQAADGIILEAGVRVKTASSSHALLTFLEGSSIKLEPNTDIEIQQLHHFHMHLL